ncbi:MAG: hypothetical protein K1Y02_03140 [Candidatus Hydrogenedentes bacterium]|nr:hypothetical protein [Candidatus Hydrogenedentota bacterium]
MYTPTCRISFILMFLVALITCGCPSDTIVPWAQIYGGDSLESAETVVQTADGGFAFAGKSFSYVDGGFYLVKTDAQGEQEWTGTYARDNGDILKDMIQTADGGYALVGNTYFPDTTFVEMYLVKTYADGDVEWANSYGAGSHNDQANSVIQSTDGGFVIAGVTYSYGAGNGDMFLVKIDSGGEQEWAKTYGGTDLDEANCVIRTSDGGYAVAGYTYSYGEGGKDMYLVKTDSKGDQVWARTFGGSGLEHANSVVRTGDGGFVLAGIFDILGTSNGDMYLVKTNSNGNQEWSRTFGGSGIDEAFSVARTLGGFALAGITYSYGTGNSDMYLVKTNDNGHQAWAKTYGGNSEEGANSVVSVAGGYIMAGFTTSYGLLGLSDMYAVRTDSDGNAPNAPSK